uniref:Uncharacterized protein n=1 Tax=Culex tarsalis TaxID=7177 RepID=A0A1Q3F9X4_CULTA
MPRRGHKQSKDPKFVAKREARKQKVVARKKMQAPIKSQLQNQNCPKQEMRNLLRRVPEAFVHNPNAQIVRFCLPDYPREWVQQEEEVEPFATFINDAFWGQTHVRRPLDIHLAGGYVLVLLPNPESTAFARSLLPGLSNFLGTGLREPSLGEIERFHASWADRSSGMFKRFGPRFGDPN